MFQRLNIGAIWKVFFPSEKVFFSFLRKLFFINILISLVTYVKVFFTSPSEKVFFTSKKVFFVSSELFSFRESFFSFEESFSPASRLNIRRITIV